MVELYHCQVEDASNGSHLLTLLDQELRILFFGRVLLGDDHLDSLVKPEVDPVGLVTGLHTGA